MGRLLFAAGVPARLKGLLFQEPTEALLLLMPCHDVHTFGMGYALDIAFLDERGCVMEAYRDVLPKRRCRCRGAKAVVERFAQPRRPWLAKGDYLDVSTHVSVSEREGKNQ